MFIIHRVQFLDLKNVQIAKISAPQVLTTWQKKSPSPLPAKFLIPPRKKKLTPHPLPLFGKPWLNVKWYISRVFLIFSKFWFSDLLTNNISKCYFIFSKFLFDGLLVGKMEKMAQNDKKSCLSHSVSQKLYIIWLWFLVHMCKMFISPAIYFIFSKFLFFRFLWGKRAKNDKITNGVCHTLCLRNCRSYDQDFLCTGVK